MVSSDLAIPCWADFRLEPLVLAIADCEGISTVKLSRLGNGNMRPELLVPPMDKGESPVDDGDILLFCRLSAVDEVADAMTEVMCAVVPRVPVSHRMTVASVSYTDEEGKQRIKNVNHP